MNIIDQAAQKHFDEMITDGDSAKTVWEVVAHCQKLVQIHDSNSWIYGQYSRSNFITPPHLITYAAIFSWAVMGKMVMVEIPVGYEPSGDSEEEENNNKLQNLPQGVCAEFLSGCGDNDGRFKWSVPLNMNIVVDGKVVASRRVNLAKYKRSAPLEVGYTTFHTTFHHLLEEGFLARWPYGSKSIYLIALDDDFRASCAPLVDYERRFL